MSASPAACSTPCTNTDTDINGSATATATAATATAAAAAPAAPASASSIFVSIISYRDPQCLRTLHDAYRRAAHPHRIYTGIVWQYDALHDQHLLAWPPVDHAIAAASTTSTTCDESPPPPHIAYPFLPSPAHLQQTFLPHTAARGPVYARALAERLRPPHCELYLQIDSHMRFRPHWDVLLASQLHELQHRWHIERPVITMYPPDFDPAVVDDGDDDGDGDANQARNAGNAVAPRWMAGASINAMCASHFGPDGMLRIVGRNVRTDCMRDEAQGGRPHASLFVAAGFLFTHARMLTDVPHDPTLHNLFFGEEMALAARLFTHGYSFFLPTEPVIFHMWSRAHRPTFREVTASADHRRVEQASRDRVLRLLVGDDDDDDEQQQPTAYGLGTRRSLLDFYAFTGVNFRTHEIAPASVLSGLAPSLFDAAAAANQALTQAQEDDSSSAAAAATSSASAATSSFERTALTSIVLAAAASRNGNGSGNDNGGSTASTSPPSPAPSSSTSSASSDRSLALLHAMQSVSSRLRDML